MALAALLLTAPLFAGGASPSTTVGPAPPANGDHGLVRAGAGFFPLPPAPPLASLPVQPGQTRRFQAAGTPAGVPGEGVAAVALNVEILTGATPATATLFPAGSEPPDGAVTVAAGAGGAASAFTIQRLPPSGELDIRGAGAPAVVTVRVRGYYAAPCGNGGAAWHPVEPAPLLDATLRPNETVATGAATGRGEAAVDAVALAIDASGGGHGHLQVHPPGVTAPDDATLAFTPGRDASVLEVVRPGPDGRVGVTNRGAAPVRVRVRLVGHHARRAGVPYQTIDPALLLDMTIRAGSPVGLRVAGAAGLPARGGTATPDLAMVATAPTAGGRLEVAATPGGEPAATVNYHAGEAAAAGTLPRPGPDGRVWLSASAGSVRVLVWAHGWFGEPARLTAAPDLATLDAFDRRGATEPGWAGGSLSAPVRLPGGGTAWLFNEAFLGVLRPDGSLPPRTPGPPRGKGPLSAIVHNSIVVQAGTKLTTYSGPVDRATGYPDALLRPAAAGDDRWYWPSSGLADGDLLRVFMQEFQRQPDGRFAWTGRNRLATLLLPRMTVAADAQLPGSEQGSGVRWGTAVLEEAGHTYVYGLQELPVSGVKRTHVARFPRGAVTGAWEFWDGVDWVADPTVSAALTGPDGTDPVAATPGSVARLGAGYVLLTIADLGRTIDVRTSCSPTGPWGPARPLYRIPELYPPLRPGDGAFLPRGTPVGDGLLVAYSLGTDGLPETMRRAAYYRPRYVRVR